MIPLTDEEWRQFQDIPEQGYSHRAWVDARMRERVVTALRDAGEASFMDWVPIFFEGESDEWINEKVRRWLNHRADQEVT